MEKQSKLLPDTGPVDDQGREILLELEHVDISFGKGSDQVRAVKDASFCIYKGETFSLVGESGSGKTTIGRAVIRVNPCSGGRILYKGVPISGKLSKGLERQVIRSIQMVFQDPAACLNERATVEYIISEGLYNFHLYENEADRRQKVEQIIRHVGLLPEHLTRYPHEFSGGQRQRIGLARAMVMRPELVIADEPISALDVSVRAQVLNLMKQFQQEQNVTYLFIAHDLSIVRFISDRIGVIYKGDIVEIAEAEELFAYPLHPYTRSLISAIPIPDPKLEKSKVLLTYDPAVHDYSREQPKLTDIGNGHLVFGSGEELRQYRAIREKNVPLKTVLFKTQEQQNVPEQRTGTVERQERSERPVYDTGSRWYTAGAFLLPPIGFIAGAVFRRFRYMRCYHACKKGAVAGLVTLGAIAGTFCAALLLSVL